MLLRKTTALTWYKDIIQEKIIILEEYLDVLEEQISSFREKQKQFIEEEEFDGQIYSYDTKQVLNNFCWKDDKRSYSMDLSDHGFYSDYIPYIHRYSALITLYSFFELELNNLCHFLCTKNKRKIKLNDMNKSKGEIDRAVRYLQKVEDLEIDKGSSTWDEIDEIRKIRNLIVPDNGILKGEQSNNKTDIRNYINNSKYFELKDTQHLRIKKGFLPHVLKTFENFILQIQIALEKKYNET